MNIKWITVLVAALALTTGCRKDSAAGSSPPPVAKTFSSFDSLEKADATFGPGTIRFVQIDITNVFALYQEISGRSLILSPALPMATKITFENTTPLSRGEVLQALDNVLAAHNIVMVYLGTKYVKVVPANMAATEPGPMVELRWDQLPDSSSFLMYVVKLNRLKPEQAMMIAQPFAKLPNSIVAVKGSGVLMLRDYSSNVRRMAQALELAEANLASPGMVQRVKEAFGETNARPAGAGNR